MPMRLKSDLYKKEQDDVIEKIISLLDLTNIHFMNQIRMNKYKIK